MAKSKPTDLAKLTPEVLLKKAAAAWKAAVRDGEQAVKLMTAAVWKARQSGEYLAAVEARPDVWGGHGEWMDYLEKNYCVPYGIGYRQATKCLQIARPDLALLTANLPQGATINQAASVAGKLNRGEQPTPTEASASTEAPEQPQPPGDANILAFTPPTEASEVTGDFTQPATFGPATAPPTEAPAPEEAPAPAPAPTEAQRQAVRKRIKAALADVKIPVSVSKALAFLEALGIGERELVERDVAGLNVE